ncbi:hypothetical protein DN069_27780 [Streptacidiphilus pinicola]|uniref:Histidine kinase/HSP90-like ATPase domain-containing protein n=1 Tax=Streptacidiphilus pinicola TaxID=2219663 RepID=A0A2X0IXD0_9ACTN|nr:ATP-binding protein [Streptacidiphilus pinicola]RAG82466.1 hypothetical protein DN069_27780 [Streptacidiphilus pinicola]
MANLVVVIIAEEDRFAQLYRIHEQNEQNQMNARKRRNVIKNPIHSVCRSTLGVSPPQKGQGDASDPDQTILVGPTIHARAGPSDTVREDAAVLMSTNPLAFPRPTRSTATSLPAPRRAMAVARSLACEASSLRRFTAAQLSGWHVSGHEHDAAVLITGELLANAVQHGRSRMRLTLDLYPRLLRISVVDYGSRRARQDGSQDLGLRDSDGASSTDLDEHGRGLAIVEALADWVSFVLGENDCQVRAGVRLSTWAFPGRVTIDAGGA